MKIRPLHDRVIVKRWEEEKTSPPISEPGVKNISERKKVKRKGSHRDPLVELVSFLPENRQKSARAFAEGAGGHGAAAEAGGSAVAAGRHGRSEGRHCQRAAEGALALPGAHRRVPAAAQHDHPGLQEPRTGTAAITSTSGCLSCERVRAIL